MSASQATLDPEGPGDDAIFDALVGLSRVCRYLALVIDDATLAPGGAADTPAGPDDASDEPLDAVLGLVSVRTTVALVLAALCSEPADGGPGDAEPAALAAWSRELLR